MIRVLALLIALSAAAQAQQVQSYPIATPRPVTTVALLPTCSASNKGLMYFVTDSLLPAALAIVANGGAVQVGVLCNGTNWIVQ